MSEYERLKKQKDEILNTRHERLVERLLDVAFRELQHDTGPTDPEYVWQRNLLKRKFTDILSTPNAPREGRAVERTLDANVGPGGQP